ncbi:unnamed protein product [Microthlaspi erraticum]|uniref:RING-type E3 ubiquitin transferase n=1 Tax=Microthlaspi erraticum TaxID=1685480 RepID=A0A6D2LKV4_9BRAS|nr:unnamed protein product [Microthlaspi erraticum]
MPCPVCATYWFAIGEMCRCLWIILTNTKRRRNLLSDTGAATCDHPSDNESYSLIPSHRDSDISLISSGRPIVELSDSTPESGRTSRMPTSSEQSIGSHCLGVKFSDSVFPSDSPGTTSSHSSESLDDVEAEMKRLKLELKQTMEMYSQACREALIARQVDMELQKLRTEDERRLEEAKSSVERAYAKADSYY